LTQNTGADALLLAMTFNIRVFGAGRRQRWKKNW